MKSKSQVKYGWYSRKQHLWRKKLIETSSFQGFHINSHYDSYIYLNGHDQKVICTEVSCTKPLIWPDYICLGRMKMFIGRGINNIQNYQNI